MARKRLKWLIESEDGVDMREIRPTRKSVDRKARELANTFGQIMYYYTNRDRTKWLKTGRLVKAYMVEPNNR